VPWIVETAVVRVAMGETVHYELVVPPAPPKLSADWSALATWDPAGKERSVPVAWTAVSPAKAELQYRMLVRDKDDHARALTTWQHETKVIVELNELPAGNVRLVIQATDGIHVAEAASEPVEVPVRPCRVSIFSPADGAKLSGAVSVELWGGGAYDDVSDTRPVMLLEWSSSVDGALGEGPSLEAVLQPGRHEITLTGGSGDRRAATAVSVWVT